jgi:hypothetical protein
MKLPFRSHKQLGSLYFILVFSFLLCNALEVLHLYFILCSVGQHECYMIFLFSNNLVLRPGLPTQSQEVVPERTFHVAVGGSRARSSRSENAPDPERLGCRVGSMTMERMAAKLLLEDRNEKRHPH